MPGVTSSEKEQVAGPGAQPARGEALPQVARWGNAWSWVCARQARSVVALLVLGMALFLAGLGQRSLWAPDEGRYAEIPREMVAAGDWLTPRLNGAKYFEKPPLHYWLVAAAFRALGETEFAARLPGALSAVLALLVVYAFGAACFGVETGLLAALILALSPLYFTLGRMDLIDTPLMLFYTAGMAAWGLALLAPRAPNPEHSTLNTQHSTPPHLNTQHPTLNTRFLALAGWAALALATLVKGPVALALPAGTVLLWLLATRRWGEWRALRPLPGLALYLAIAAPWFIAVTRKNPEFAWFFFVHEHLMRFLTREAHREGPVYYYLPVLLIGFFPWWAWLPAATRWSLARGSSRDAAAREARDTPREVRLWLLLWAAVPVLFFSVSSSKLITYILPAFPALALLVAAWWPRSTAEKERLAALRRGGLAAAAGAALLAVALALAPRVTKESAAGLAPWVSLAALAAAGIAAGVPLAARRREPGWVSTTIMGMLLVLAVALDRTTLALDESRGMRRIAAPVRALPEARLVMVDCYDQAFNFYSRHRAVIAGAVGELSFGRDHAPDAAAYFIDRAALPSLLAQPGAAFYLVHRSDWGDLSPLFAGRARVVAEARKHLLLFTPGGMDVAASR